MTEYDVGEDGLGYTQQVNHLGEGDKDKVLLIAMPFEIP